MCIDNLKNCKKILIEVNQKCNLNCSYCFYRDYGRVSESLNLTHIEEMFIKCPNADEFYVTGGECFISKHIEAILETLHKKGKVVVFTNGIILNSYNEVRLKNVLNNVDRFIISFDSFDFNNYLCRQRLNETLNTIKKIAKINREKLEVKICISNYNYIDINNIFKKLIELDVKYLSVNFVFDIKNSLLKHEVNDFEKLEKIFEIIDNYKPYFNEEYITVLKDLYLENKENNKFPCLADKEYFYLDCQNNYLICPGNCKKIGDRGNWKQCYSKECANEWEIMYMR